MHTCCWKGKWIFVRPRAKSLPCPLNTPDGCNSLFYFVLFHFIVDLCAWLMHGHLYASMNVSVSSDEVIFLYNCLTGILNEYQYTSFTERSFPHICVFICGFKCLSSVPLLPSMHKHAHCSELTCALCSVNNFPVKSRFCIYFVRITLEI